MRVHGVGFENNAHFIEFTTPLLLGEELGAAYLYYNSECKWA